MAVIGWGKPRVFVKKVGDTSWFELPTAVEGTTSLATTKGSKTEAKIEGGENEDVRYSKNTYALTLNIRAAKNRKRPFDDNDGIIDGNYEVMLQPEDAEVDGIYMQKSTVSVEDTWTAADGGVWAYTFDALKPDDNTDQVKWGVVSVDENGTPSFTESE